MPLHCSQFMNLLSQNNKVAQSITRTYRSWHGKNIFAKIFQIASDIWRRFWLQRCSCQLPTVFQLTSQVLKNFLIKDQIHDNTSERNISRAILFLFNVASSTFLNLFPQKVSRNIKTYFLRTIFLRLLIEFDDYLLIYITF